jgi:hypothetical protein
MPAAIMIVVPGKRRLRKANDSANVTMKIMGNVHEE